MSPRSLLFSSSEETSRQLVQALLELDFGVDPYREIFAALEKINTCSYDLIVVDGKDGAEAAFLLKIAQETKRNPALFTVVLEDAGKTACDPSRTALALRGPFRSEQVKYDLLTSDAFLVAMRSWVSRSQLEDDRGPSGAPVAQPAFDTAHSPLVVAELRVAAHAIEPSPLATRAMAFREADGFDPLEDVDASMGVPATLQTLFEAANAEAQSRPKRRPLVPLLCCIGLGAALLATDYRFGDDPWWGKVANASSNLLLSASKSKILELNSSGPPPSTTQSRVSALQGRALGHGESSAWVRVTEVRASKALRPLSPSSNGLLPEAEIPASQVQTSSSPISPASLSPARQPIPESLLAVARPSVSEPDAPAGVSSRAARALLPVNLTEGLANQLLLERTQPSYPERALKTGLQGSVVLEALIGTDGVIRDLKLLSGSLLLGKAACEAVKQWRYKPVLRNGHAVEAETLVTIDFKLP